MNEPQYRHYWRVLYPEYAEPQSTGFRHEHIRPEVPEFFNPESLEHTIELTKYDPKSVMHYLGKNVGDPKLRFTKNDKQGARLVYGGPDAEYSFAD
jgi:hypothetical protein